MLLYVREELEKVRRPYPRLSTVDRAMLGLASLALQIWAADAAQAQAATAQASGGFAVEEIIVTARKREERLQDVPVAVSAFSSEDLDRGVLRNVESTLGRVPNLYVSRTTNTPTENSIILRGIGIKSPLEPSVAVFLDGVYMPSNRWSTGFLELDRVEVLRGPQGALFGRNTQAGVINLVSKQPQEEFSGRARLEYDDFDTTRGNVYLTGPLGDTLLFSLAAQAGQTDGFMLNRANGTDLLAREDQAVRLSLKVPGERVNATLHMDWSGATGGLGSPNGHIVDSPDPSNQAGRWEESLDFNNWEKTDGYGASLSIDYDLGAATLTSITGFRHTWSFVAQDADSQVTPDYGAGLTPPDVIGRDDFPRPTGFTSVQTRDYVQDILSQEVRIASTGEGAFNWLGGIYAYKERNDIKRDFVTPNVPRGAFAANFVKAHSFLDLTGYAVFAQASYEFFERLELSAGLRYSDERVEELVDLAFIATPLLTNAYTSSPEESFSRFVPQGSLRYRWSDDVSSYLSVAQGYKGGGFSRNPPAFEVSNIAFESEVSTNYEFGTKASFLGGALVTDIAVFYIETDDAQVTKLIAFPGGINTPAVTNAAQARSQGFELELAARPIDALQLRAAVGHTDAEYVEYEIQPGVDRSGTRIENVPDWLGSVGADVTLPFAAGRSIILGADYTYVGAQEQGSGQPSSPTVQVGAFDRIDVRATLMADRWDVTLFADNLLDSYNVYERVLVVASANTNPAITPLFEKAEAPRRIGVRFTYRFD